MAHIEDTSADVKPRGTVVCILHRISSCSRGVQVASLFVVYPGSLDETREEGR